MRSPRCPRSDYGRERWVRLARSSIWRRYLLVLFVALSLPTWSRGHSSHISSLLITVPLSIPFRFQPILLTVGYMQLTTTPPALNLLLTQSLLGLAVRLLSLVLYIREFSRCMMKRLVVPSSTGTIILSLQALS